jgi:hypothetical protein
MSMQQGSYADAAKAYNALPEADRAAAEPPDTVKAARETLNAEADRLIETAATFVAFGKAKNLPAATVDRVNQLLETVYKGRFPEDATLEGLTKILADKGVPTPKGRLARERSEGPVTALRGRRAFRFSCPPGWRGPGETQSTTAISLTLPGMGVSAET